MITNFYKTNRNWNRIVGSFLIRFVGCCMVGVCGGELIAQNCDAGGGNIISNRTFGTGPTGALPEGFINYQYVNNDCPNDGYYTVEATVSDTCFIVRSNNFKSWHGLQEDHTPGDIQGNMLVINAPYPGEISRETIPGLCTKATYNYSFWMVNLNTIVDAGTCGFEIPNDPNITIQIELPDGRVIGSFVTGAVLRTQMPVWRSFGLNFSIPAMAEETTDVVIRLIDTGEGGCGNDFAIDDLVLKRCTDCESPSVFVPDVFTPNNDGVNDLLEMYLSNVAAFEFIVYNRWGSAVFVSRDPTVKWDGKFKGVASPEGVYTWSITYEFTGSSQKYTKNGQVTLLY